MARRPNAEPIYKAADLFRRQCFTTGHSLLWPDQEAWTAKTLAQLWEAIIGRPDEGKGRFEEKLRDQLAPLSDDAHRVAADTMGFYSLFSTTVTPQKKEKNLEEIVSWRFKNNPPNMEVFQQAFEARGIGSAGPHYNTSIPWQFAYVLKFAELALLDHTDLTDPAAGKGVAERALQAVPQAVESRHILLHLLFPDDFERIASERHKQRIARVFARFANGARDVDVALSNIRKALVANSGRPDVDFYDRDIESQWEGSDNVEEEVATRESLRDGLESFLSGYVAARTNEPYRSQSPIVQVLRRLQTQFERSEPVRRRPSLRVAASAGAGNWAGVPWIGFLDTRETTSIQKGVYCVYLFREDMTGIYLTLNQGVSEPTQQRGWRSAERQLLETVARLRPQFPQLQSRGFSLTDDIDLRAHGDLGQMYEVATIAHRLYPTGAIPGDEALLEDLDSVLSAYGQYVEGGTTGANAWIFQANPDLFDVGGALRQLKELTWLTNQHADSIRAGDTVFIWQSGEDAGIVAMSSVLTDPQPMEQLEEEEGFNRSGEKFAGLKPRVRIRIDRVLPIRLERSRLLGHPVLGGLTVLTAPQGTNFRVTREQADALKALIADESRNALASARLDLRVVADEFGAALRASHVSFGNRHDEVVRSFVASLATKRFVILTGLSGSGKTQLGLRFGEWMGEDRSLVVPVRPDWTGAESLFGYEDALREASAGRRAWQVPASLEFMLRAARDPYHPYVLVLDEMNLAHVERYFADVLSGMESAKACLPNLEEEGDGLWRIPVGAKTTIPVPTNLVVIGTVNVDETTYMFSPKVLDRANTFEFRVRTSDLELAHEKPIEIHPGDPELVAGFLAIASDDRWQIDHPAPSQEVFAQHLRTAHALLSKDGFEFGHRVFYEAVRFAAMLVAAGDDDPLSALDLQVMQKVLPRLHGSRRRLEPTLCALGRFCYDLSFDAQAGLRDAATRFDETPQAGVVARLPISYEKVSRMVSTLRANQFVSFTE